MLVKLPFDPLLHRSGVNSSFHGGNGSFQDYIQHMENVIGIGRVDLTATNRQKIISTNSPFEFRPDKPTKKGILLIHGLYDSPYTMRDIAQHFYHKDFLVRAILLPGHGTRPGDLLGIDYQEWLKATEFGVNNLKKEVDEVYLLGYSMGGALAINYALDHQEKIKALLLFAPALKPRRFLAQFLIFLHKITGFFLESQQWYQRVPQTTYARYESFSCNNAEQACLLMKKTRHKARQKSLAMPIFMVITQADESINIKTSIEFFQKQKNIHNQLLIYANEKELFNDARIIVRKSAYPEQRILDFAHTSLITAPHNSHYGKEGDFKDFQHYHYDASKYAKEIYFGAITPKNLRRYAIQRLSYNPDYPGLLQTIDKFIKKIS